MKIKDLKIAIGHASSKNTLNLRKKSIGYEGAKPIADAIKENKTPPHLFLRDNKIGNEGVKLIAEALKTNKNVLTLDLTGNEIGDEGAKLISEVLQKNIPLSTLKLAKNKIGDEGAEAIAKALEKNDALTNLSLSNNPVCGEGVNAILEVLKTNSSITSLGFSGFYYTNLNLILEVIKVNKTLAALDISSSFMVDEEGMQILDALKKNKTLTTLSFSDSNMSNKVEKLISEALEANKKHIKEVASFLSETYSINKIGALIKTSKKDSKDEKVKENFTKEIKYLKLFQAIDKNLLEKELINSGKENTKEFLQKVDTYIKTHLFQVSGVIKNPVSKIAYGGQNLKGEKNDSFSPDYSVKSGSKRKLTEDSATGSSKAIKITDSVESKIFNDPLIASTIAEFLGDKKCLFAIKIASDSNVQQLGDNSEMSDEDMWE